MSELMKIGELAGRTGFTTKTIRYYELVGLIDEPKRTESGYRLYGTEDAERLAFIEKAKRLGLSLEDIRDILDLSHEQAPCVHVLALLDQKLKQIENVIHDLSEFRDELTQLRQESAERLEQLPADAKICGIIEQGIHAKGEAALVWLEFRPDRKGATHRRQRFPQGLTLTLTGTSKVRKGFNERKHPIMAEEVVLKVPTLHCSSCVRTATRTLEALPSVSVTDANFESKLVHVQFDQSKLNPSQIREALDQIGFSVED